MAQVKIFGERQHLARNRQVISNTVHAVMCDVLRLPQEKRFQRFIALDVADFVFPEDRGGSYTIIEVLMFAGRSRETRRLLLNRLMADISNALGCPIEAIEVTLIETARDSWGIRGMVADELKLDYDVSR